MAGNKIWNNVSALPPVGPVVGTNGALKAELTDEQMARIENAYPIATTTVFAPYELSVGERSPIWCVDGYDAFTMQYHVADINTEAIVHVLGSLDSKSEYYPITTAEFTENGTGAISGEFGRDACPDCRYIGVAFIKEVGGAGATIGMQIMLRKFGSENVNFDEFLKWIAEKRLNGEDI